MIDFQNLTEEQKEFLTTMWPMWERSQQGETKNNSVQRFNAYAEKRRTLEQQQAQAADILKTMMK
ncbi:MAG: hypothetical protein IKW83_07390 [Muribaculaceae bacterium]|nr:hypothetical protein [Muribaculaceae bacterium]